MLAFNSEQQKPTADIRKISSTNIILIEGSVVKGTNGVLKDKHTIKWHKHEYFRVQTHFAFIDFIFLN